MGQRIKKLLVLLLSFSLLFAVGVLPGHSVKAETGALLFADDFEDGDAVGWSASGFNVVSEGGSLVYKHVYATGNSTTRYATAGNSAWTSYSVTAKLNNFNENNKTGLYARMKDSNNFYALNLDLKNDTISLSRKVGGVSTTLDSASVVLNTGTAYTLRLDVDGTTLTGYVDGVQLLDAVDASLTSGRIGLGGYSKHSYYFDDVSVVDLRRPVGMAVEPLSLTLLQNEGRQFTGKVYDQDNGVISGLPLNWTSDDPGIAIVDGSGFVTAVNPGTTVIRAVYGTLSASSSITVKEFVPELPLEVNKVLSPVHIDGVLDENVWSLDRAVEKNVIGVSENTAVFGTLWDDQYLYVGVSVQDNLLVNDSTDNFDDDSVEIFIDADHNHGTVYDLKDWHFNKGYNDSGLYEMLQETAGVKHAWSAVPGGYAVEMAIPWKNLGVQAAPGVSIGFDVAVNDDDDGGQREGQLVWAGTADNYRNTFAFGDLILSANTVGTPVTPPVPVQADRYVTPDGAGAMDGSSWANAFQGNKAGGLQAAWEATGTAKTLYVGSGAYTVPQTLNLTSGGQDVLNMKKLAGVDTGGGLPVFTGPYTLANQIQSSFINVPLGISYWTVQDIVVRNYYFGIYANGQHEGIRILNVSVHDMSDGVYLWGRATRSNPDAGSHDIIIKDGEYTNYTKSAVRFRNGNYLASVINVTADAGGQANWRSGNFPMSFRIGNSPEKEYFFEHDIVFQDVTASNSWHQATSGDYWNGDGFTAERQAYNITYIRSKAFGSTDGGWDDKSLNPVLINTVAMDNKRNYRFWNDATFIGVFGGYSHKRGGSGDAPGLWVGSNTGKANIYYSTFYNNQNSEISLDSAVNQVNIYDSIIGKTAGSLYTLSGGQITATRTEEYIGGVQGNDPQFVNGGNAAWDGEGDDFNSLLYGNTKGFYNSGPYDTPYTVQTSVSSLSLGLYGEETVTAQVYDENNNPVADPEKIVWYSDDGYTSRLLQSRGAAAVVQGLNAGVTDLVAVYKGAEARIRVTVSP